GEDVVAGQFTPVPIQHMAEAMPETYAQFVEITHRLETHYRDMQDIEFTIERGKLWMLQTRTGKRTGQAATRIAVDMVAEGLITHAAVVARGMGKCCVVGCNGLEIDYPNQLFCAGGVTITRGDWITVDGTSGQVLQGQVATIEPKLDENFDTLMAWADERRG